MSYWKMRKGTSRSGIADIWNRETGHLMPRAFSHRFWASKELVLRFGIYKKLEKHRGCVNTVNFNADGNILISGSDDRMVMLWDWDAGTVKLGFHTGHGNNIFDVKFIPYTKDRGIVTCAADGEVRQAQILEGGKVDVKTLVQHQGCAHKVVLGPENPHTLYSCGEDGFVNLLDLRTGSAMPFFTCKSFQRSSFNQINPLYAMAIPPRNPNIIAVAGADEYARLFDIRKCQLEKPSDMSHLFDCFCPPHLIGSRQVVITGLAFSEQCELLASYSDELIYLFGMHDGLGPDPSALSPGSLVESGTANKARPLSESPSLGHSKAEPRLMAYEGHSNSDTMKRVKFFGPNSEYVISGSDCGRIFIWGKKDGKLLRVMEGDKHVVNCVQSHPHSPILATSGIEDDIKIWIPNVSEAAPPVNMDEVPFVPDRIAWSDYAYDYDYVDRFDDDDGVDGDDNDDDENNCCDFGSESGDDFLTDNDDT